MRPEVHTESDKVKAAAKMAKRITSLVKDTSGQFHLGCQVHSLSIRERGPLLGSHGEAAHPQERAWSWPRARGAAGSPARYL